MYKGVGSIFDPFGIGEQTVQLPTLISRSIAEDPKAPGFDQSTTVTTDILLTPVAWSGKSVIVGYSNTTGAAFNPANTQQQSGTFQGKSGLNGRFAYDLDNDHILMVINGITPLVSGIVDISFVGLARNRLCYTIPNLPYGPKRLPSRVLVLLTSLETKSDSSQITLDLSSPSATQTIEDDIETVPPINPPNSSCSQLLQSSISCDDLLGGSESNIPKCLPFETSLEASNETESDKQYTQDIKILAGCMHDLTVSLHGVYQGTQMRRKVYDPINQENVLSSESGHVTGVHALPKREHRNQMVAHGWNVYSTWKSKLTWHVKKLHERSSLGKIYESVESNFHSVTFLTWPGCSSSNVQHKIDIRDASVQTEPYTTEKHEHKRIYGNSHVSPVNFSNGLENLDIDSVDRDVTERKRIGDEMDVSRNIVRAVIEKESCPDMNENDIKSGLLSTGTPTEKVAYTPLMSTTSKVHSENTATLVRNTSQLSCSIPQVVMVPVVSMIVDVPIIAPAVPSPTSDLGVEVSVGDNSAKDIQVCYGCRGLVGRSSVLTLEENMLRVRKSEEKKRRNRLSAARSNERRKLQVNMQRSHLEAQKERVVELERRKLSLESENKLLRKCLQTLSKSNSI